MAVLTAIFGVFIAALSAWATTIVKNAFEERKQRIEWRKELLEKYKGDQQEFQKFSQQFSIGIIFVDDKINTAENYQKYFIPRNFSFTIGRSPNCDVVIGERTASRIHCLVTATNNKLFIEDLAPTNPTVINDEKVSGRVEIKNHIEANVGSTVIKVVKLASTTDDMNRLERWVYKLISG